MSQFFKIHGRNPQLRLLNRAVAMIRDGAVIVYPTDSCYALGCHIGDKLAQDRIRRIRRLGPEHNFTLVCRDLSQLSEYGKLDNVSYRLMRALTPGPYTFLLRASREVPRRLQNPRRKTIGVRVPDHVVAHGLLDALGEPLMNSTLLLPDEEMAMTEPELIRERLGDAVDLVIDGGNCGFEPTTVVDLVDGEPQVLRVGRGPIDMLEH